MCRRQWLLLWTLPLWLAGCNGDQDGLPGTVEWDRVNILTEVSEPVVKLAVKEGDWVEQGQLLLQLDPRRQQARLDTARAQLASQQARLDELQHGARQETVAAARADLAAANSQAHNASLALKRARDLYQKGSLARSQLDDSENALRTANARVDARRARLTELLHGTRPEQLDQAEAAVAAARAQVRQLALTRQRLDVVAPAAGRVDALPHRLGDQPPVGSPLVTLLTGQAPYARIFVPEGRRATIQPGDRYRVQVDGVAQPFSAVVRSVRSDPAFTPYYALSGDDASRLTYRAELLLQGDGARQLPAGVPCRAWPQHGAESGHGQ
ncbi:MAG: HlyD family efflux transporter periplasmic adaptor subunit [Alcanivorax sp.]|nr:HlyD family efflux transporter periplasmic adaptor subunit [Alcanivorax sp.]